LEKSTPVKNLNEEGREFMQSKPAMQERDSWTSMFQPDVLAAAQYMDKWRYQGRHEPEKMLMCAVLEDAITCFQKFSSASTARGRAMFEEAENWLMHEESDWLFSFEYICQTLNLDPDYIRAGLTRWRTSERAHHRKVRLFYVVRTGRRVRKTM
jgi:hypothetical protein